MSSSKIKAKISEERFQIIFSMLKMSLKWRLIATIASLVLALVLTFTAGFGYSFIFWLIFLVFVTGYFLLGTITSASEQLNFGNIDGAEKILGYTKFPKLLLKMNQAYFHLLSGMIALQRNETEKGEELLKLALETGLPTDNDKAMVLLNLAHVNYSKRKYPLAKAQLRQIKEMDVKEPSVVSKVAELEQALKMVPSGMQAMKYRGMGGRSQQRKERQDPGKTNKKDTNKHTQKKKKRKK